MKWVVGSVAVLVALVLGIAIGWKLRGGEVAYYQHLLAPSRSPSASSPLLPPPIVTTAPPVTTAKPHELVEDTEVFAWPSAAVKDVVAVDATHYLVKRAYLDKVLGNNELFASVRIIPVVIDGGPAGVKVFGIRAGTSAAMFGLKNGDTLVSMNGLPLAQPDEALETYTRVRDGKKLLLAIERTGAQVDLHYRVID